MVSRAKYIAGLRALADLLEQVPELPHYEWGFPSFALGGSDEEAFAAMDAAAAALKAAGVLFRRDEYPGSVGIEITVAGMRYAFSRIDARRSAENEARRSYSRNIQVQDERAGGAL